MSLESVREKKSSKTTYAMIILLLVGMAGFGTSQFNLSSTSRDTALSLGDQRITIPEIEQEEQLIKQRSPNASAAEVRLEVVERASRQLALLNFLDEYPFTASRAEVATAIRANPQFSTNGQFDSVKYQALVGDVRAYEKQQVLSLGMQQFQEGIIESAISSDSELAIYLDSTSLKRDVQFVVLDRDNYPVEVTDDEVKAYFDENKSLFMSKEKVDIKYIELTKANLEKSYTITEADKDKAYEEYLKEHQKNATRSADYMLFDKDKAADAQEAFDKIQAGSVTFDAEKEALADQLSDSGTIGPSANGEGVSKELDKAMFAIDKVSDIAGPIETEDGVFIIKLTQVSAPEKTKEQMQDQLDKLARTQRADKDFVALSKKAEDAIYSNDTASVESISKAIDFPVDETGLVDVDARNKIVSNPDIKKVLLDTQNKPEVGKLQAPVVKSNSLIVYEFSKIEAPKQEELSAVQDQAKEKLIDKKTTEALEKDTAEIVDLIKKQGIEKVVADKGLELNSVKNLTPQTKNDHIDPLAMHYMLSELPQLGDKNVKVTNNIKNDRIIYVVNNVDFGGQTTADEQKQIEDRLANQSGQLELASFINAITSDAKIKQHSYLLNAN